eukprot:TRINITY_DN75960_c0_g1_i1.p1 TRINITY_DN75960_c0_g1~~TRINITY_DN75960_c0_g1_i1.p1  ORF type:complete len:847 (+),score=244.67 TRINITY_DN75960_c0_g1_i1:43-2583(+)
MTYSPPSLGQKARSPLVGVRSARSVAFPRPENLFHDEADDRYVPDAGVSPRSPGHSHAILMRCRDTIERLQSEVEEERQNRADWQRRAQLAESDLDRVRSEAGHEKSRREESESKAARLERQLAESDGKLHALKRSVTSLEEQLEQAKAEGSHKAQDVFAKSVRITELEGTVRRAEAAAAAAQAETSRAEGDSRDTADRLIAAEAEVAQLRASLEAETTRAQRSARFAEERERRCDELQRELDEVQSTMQMAEDSLREQLTEAKRQNERSAAAWREREAGRLAEYKRLLSEREDKAEVSSAGYAAELSDLKKRYAVLEADAQRHEQDAVQFKTEANTLESRVVASQRERASECQTLSDELSQTKAENTKVRTEAEATKAELDRLLNETKQERQGFQERWFAHCTDKTRTQERLDDSERKLVQTEEKLHNLRCAEATALAKSELRARDEMAEVREAAKKDLHEAVLKLTEQRSENTFSEERLSEASRSQRHFQESFLETRAQVAELTWRLGATNEELERARAALAAEQQAKQGWAQQEDQSRREAERLRQKCSDEGQQVLRCHEELWESQERLKQREEEVRDCRAQLKHAGGEYSALAEMLRRMETDAGDAKRRATDIATAEVAEAKREAAELRRELHCELSEFTARSSAAQVEALAASYEKKAEALEKQARVEAAEAALKTKVDALSSQLAQCREQLARSETQASEAQRRSEAESHAYRRFEGAESMAQRRLEGAEKLAVERAEVRAERQAEERAQLKMERLKDRCERKVATLYSQLHEKENQVNERNLYANKIETLVKHEVDMLRQCHRDTDSRGPPQSSQAMRHLAEDVERRILRTLRTSDKRF